MESIKQLKDRVKELEAMVAVAQPPSPDWYNWDTVMSWSKDQRRIKRKLDGIKKARRTRKEAHNEEH